MDIYIDAPSVFIVTSNDILLNAYHKAKDRGVNIRVITEITSFSLYHIQKMFPLVNETRHIDGLIGTFGISEKDYIGTDVSPIDTLTQRAIHCNLKVFLQQQQYFFDSLWNKAIPVEQKIKEIERGIVPAKIETITDPSEIEAKYIRILEKATDEILLIFPTLNSMRCQFHIGIIQVLKKSIFQHNNLKVRILFPSFISVSSSPSNKTLLKEKAYLEHELELNNISIYENNVFIRSIEPSISTKSTIIVVDRKESLVIEVKNDLKEKFSESMGFGTYSNSAATVISYVSIFESFWSYSDIVEKLKESEELQKDFVHIAAHELKNPIQPILGLSGILLKYKPDENEFYNIIKTINRNAKKINQLTNDILDITKIETNNLNLNKEFFNLGDLISDIIDDYTNQLDNENVKLTSKFMYPNKFDEKNGGEGEVEEEENKYNISVFADRTRINQVISNLLNNAIKFTNKGFINIIIEKKYTENKVNINVKDTGCGIDQIILPKLFSKFATKSKGGTGLGLYISKNIIEAHDGQIYANNNKDGKGATFGFSLPIIE